MHERAPFGFRGCRNSFYFMTPSILALRMSMIDFSQTVIIMECSVCEREERESMINTCGGQRWLSIVVVCCNQAMTQK